MRLRMPKCKKCKRSIRPGEEAVEALGGKWCWSCFVCAVRFYSSLRLDSSRRPFLRGLLPRVARSHSKTHPSSNAATSHSVKIVIGSFSSTRWNRYVGSSLFFFLRSFVRSIPLSPLLLSFVTVTPPLILHRALQSYNHLLFSSS